MQQGRLCPELSVVQSCYRGRGFQMPFRVQPALAPDRASLFQVDTGAGENTGLTPEQDYRVRVMGEEELELLRAAASQDGLRLASLNWILASLANHDFVAISFNSDRRMRAVATNAGYLALALRPLLPVESVH
jgi:hypothetical protein